MGHRLKQIIVFGFIIFGTWLIIGISIHAQSPADIFENIRVVQENGRQVAKVRLRDVLQIALQRSLLLQSSKVGEKVAQQALIASRDYLTPTVTNSVEYGKNVSLGFSSVGNNFATWSSSNSMTLSSTYSQKSSLGVAYGVTYAEVRSQSKTLIIPEEGDPPESGDYSDWRDTNSLSAFVTIPISQDWGEELYEIPINMAKLGVKSSSLETRQNQLNILKQVASIYWDLVGILEGIRVQKEAVQLSEQLLKENEARLEAGIISPTDVRVTKTQLAREKQILLSSELDALRVEDLVRAALNLGILEMGFHPIDVPTLKDGSFQFEKLQKKVYQNDTNIVLLEIGLEQKQQELLELKNKEKTDLDLEFRYSLNGYSSSAFGGVSDFSQTELNGMSTKLTWTVPLFDHATADNIRKIQLEKQQVQLQIENIKSDLSINLQSTIRSLRLAKKQVETAQTVMQLAKEQLQNEIYRFQLGKSTSFQVSQFQQEAALSRQEEILARVRYEKTYLDMLILTNDIFEYYELIQ